MEESDAQSQSSEFIYTEDSPVRAGSSKGANSNSSRTSGMDKSVSTQKGKKSKRVSKTASLQQEYEQKFKSLEESMNNKFDQLLQLFQVEKTSSQNRENTVLSRSDLNVGNVPTGERRPLDAGVEGNGSVSGVRRPIIALEPNLDEDLGSPRVIARDDLDTRSEISLHVNGEERDFLNVRSDPESDTGDSIALVEKVSENYRKSDRFTKHVVMNSEEQVVSAEIGNSLSEKSNKVDVLSKIFKEDVNKAKARSGLILDQAQIDILSDSWRSSYPDRISAYKEEYKNCFPINDNSVEFLQVPTLDDLMEVMLRQTHGLKAVKGWDTRRQLFSQPYKQIEKLGFQGQLGARMNIISLLYIQQALGSLAQSVESGNFDKHSLGENIKDIFAMSTKSLDQAGRAGAFFHLIRRKAAAQDTGLVKLSDLRSKCQYLPLTEEGLFGKALESCLEKRKEQNDQLKDWLPEYCSDKNKKRKSFDYDNDYSAKKVKCQVSEGTKNVGNKGNPKFPNNLFFFWFF